MQILWSELSAGFPDYAQFAHVIIRLLAAALLGGVVGLQREKAGKPAGLRTHILVASGTALFVVASTGAGFTSADVSRVVQGLATGIGFLGAGAILKLQERREIHGLTTAAGIWMTAAIGVTVGLGALGLALLSTALTWIVLASFGRFEREMSPDASQQSPPEKKVDGSPPNGN